MLAAARRSRFCGHGGASWPCGCVRPDRTQKARRLAQPDREALRRAADQSFFVIESGLGQSAAIAAEQAARLEANPFPLRSAEEVDGEIAIDEHIFCEVQRGADAVTRISSDGHALIGARMLALDERMVHAKPGGAGTVEEAPCGKPIFDQLAVTSPQLRHRDLDDRAFVGRLRRGRRRMARSAVWNGRILLALR